MKTVWKYLIPAADEFELLLPAGAEILHVAEQDGQPCLWALVNPDAPAGPRRFRFAGTGHAVSGRLTVVDHVGTVLLHGGSLVFHLFEIRGPAS